VAAGTQQLRTYELRIRRHDIGGVEALHQPSIHWCALLIRCARHVDDKPAARFPRCARNPLADVSRSAGIERPHPALVIEPGKGGIERRAGNVGVGILAHRNPIKQFPRCGQSLARLYVYVPALDLALSICLKPQAGAWTLGPCHCGTYGVTGRPRRSSRLLAPWSWVA
jgi:hypothetical protein